MDSLTHVLRELCFRFGLFLFGVRFYELQVNVSTYVDYEFDIELDPNISVNFKFHKVPCSDIVLKRGILSSAMYTSFIVHAYFSIEGEAFETPLNGKSFFFNGGSDWFGIPEERVLRLIADIYLDYIKTKLLHPSLSVI